PAPATDVEHPPRVAGTRADGSDVLADHERAFGRTRVVLRREVEQLVAPRDHHVERLVTGRQVYRDVEPARSTVAFGPGNADVRAGRVVGDVEIETVVRDAQRCRARSFRKSLAFRARYGNAVSARLAGDEVGPPNVGQPDVIDVGIHGRNHEVAREHGPVVPALVPAPLPSQIRAVQRAPGPAAGGRGKRRAVGRAEIDGLGELALVRHLQAVVVGTHVA